METEVKDKAVEKEAGISRYPENVQEALRQGLPLRAAYRNLLTQYSRVTTPKKDLLAEYVVRAKGPERSLRQFAEELGVNVSTLSRIVNQKTASANSDALIADIAAMADKNSGITFEMLMDAHGLVNTVRGTAYGLEKRIEEAISMVIFRELLRRGYSLAQGEETVMNTLGGRYRFDFAFITDAIGRGDGRWGFEIYISSFEKGKVDSRYRAMNLMRRVSMLGGLYANWDYPYDRASLVVTDKDAYYAAVERLRNCYLKNEITVILVDLEREVVEDEFLIPWIEESSCKPVFTELDELEEDNSEEDAWNEMYGEDV